MGQVLIAILNLYSLILLVRVLLSWFPDIDHSSQPVQMLYAVTEPVLSPIRTFLRQQFPEMGMFDFSPLVVFFGIMILNQLIVAVF